MSNIKQNSTLKYISSEVLVAEVKNILKNYFDSGKIDESYLYPVIKRCLSKLRLNTYPTKFTVLEVEDFKADLPEDFYYMTKALGCTPELVEVCDPTKESIVTMDKEVCELDLCESKCSVCHDHCGNMFKMTQVLPRTQMKLQWNQFDILKVGRNSLKSCAAQCFNKMVNTMSKNTIEITNNKIHTTFESGLIYFEYLCSLEDSDSTFQIPENETIIQWIKDEMIYELYKILFYNGEPNIQQRLQLAKSESNVSNIKAMVIYKRSELHEHAQSIKVLRDRYLRASEMIFDNYIYKTEVYTD
jgi:hypothetical protein